MADIFDLGVDFGLSYFKSKTEKEKVTRKEYNRNPVDFYNQSLEESTGIGVLGDPVKKEKEEEAININTIGKPEEGGSENPNALDMNQMLSESSFVSKAISSELKNTPTDIMSWQYTAPNKTYGEALASKGFKDRSPTFTLFDTDMYFATAPRSGKDVKEGIKGAFSWESLAKKGLGYLGIDPLVSGVAGAFITGRAVPNALGKDSYRPDHAFLGGVFDAVNSIQFADVAINSAAVNAYTGSGMSNQFSPTTGYDHVAGRATGFNAEVGGHLVTKRAGSTSYTGGFQSHETNKAVEALTKGYLPSTYNNKNETGERGVTSRDSRGGMYSERGTYHYVGGTAAAGSLQAARDLAIARGITTQEAIDGLNKVRSQYNIFGLAKDKTKTPKTLTQIFAEKANKKFKDSSYSYTTRDIKDYKGTITKNMFDKTDPTKNLTARDKLNKAQIDASTAKKIADAEAVSKTAYQEMIKRQAINQGQYTQGENDTGSGEQSASDQAATADQQGGMFTAKGGFVSKGNFALGGEAEPAGFIEGPPEQFNDQTTIADDIPLTVKDGTFVLNAPAVENEGSSSVRKMLAEGYQKAMTRDVGNGHSIQTGKIPNRGELDIQISRGEVVVPPHVAKAIGYDRLEKINNRGKREVERRQKAGNQEKVQAGQGFAATGGEQNKLDPIKKYLSIADVKKQFKPFGSYKNAKAARVEIARLLKSLPEEDALALAMYSEADVLGEEGLEGVAHVVMNRMKAKDNKGNRYRNFGKDMYNTLLATYEGEGGERIFEFNGLEPSGFRKALKAFTNKEDKYMQVRNIAEDVFKGSRKDFTKNSLYYYNPYTTTSDWYKDQVKTGKFKEVHRTLNPDKKQTKSVHVYHTPIDDYFQELEVNVIPQETPTEKFKPLDDLPQPIRRPNPEPEPDRSGGGGFMFRGVGKNYETEGIISIN